MLADAAQGDLAGPGEADAEVIRDAFEQLPVLLAVTVGPDHRMAAMNAACRAYTGRDAAIGMPLRDAFPEISGQLIFEMLDRVYATGQPQTGRDWRVQAALRPGGVKEAYANFIVAPLRTGGTITGLLVAGVDVTERAAARRAAGEQAASAEDRYARALGIVAELQGALLPTALPVLPRARIAGRYLVAGDEQAAGGDWFDAIPWPTARWRSSSGTWSGTG